MKKIYFLLISFLLFLPINIEAKTNKHAFFILEKDPIITDLSKDEVSDDSYLVCGENQNIPYQIVRVARSIVQIIKFVVPVLLIIMGMFDFGKVVIGKPDEQMKKSKSAFISRIVAAGGVFLVVSIVEMLLRLVTVSSDPLHCLKCIILDEGSCKYIDITYPEEDVKEPINTPTPEETIAPSLSPSPSNDLSKEDEEPTVTPSAKEEINSEP